MKLFWNFGHWSLHPKVELESQHPAERQEKRQNVETEEWQEEVKFRHWGCAAHSRWAVQHMLNSEQRPLRNSQEARAPTGANRRHIRGSHVVSEPKSQRSPWKVITSTEQQVPVKLCCTFLHQHEATQATQDTLTLALSRQPDYCVKFNLSLYVSR